MQRNRALKALSRLSQGSLKATCPDSDSDHSGFDTSKIRGMVDAAGSVIFRDVQNRTQRVVSPCCPCCSHCPCCLNHMALMQSFDVRSLFDESNDCAINGTQVRGMTTSSGL